MNIIDPITANKTTIAPNIANSGGIAELDEKQSVNIKLSPIPPSNIVKKVIATLSGMLILTSQSSIIESLLKVDYIKSKSQEQPKTNDTRNSGLTVKMGLWL